MALPSTLRAFNLFTDGDNWRGMIPELNLPKLKRKVEDWQGGGMGMPIKNDHGLEALQLTWSVAGADGRPLEEFGTPFHDGVLLRFVGAYQSEDADTPDTWEITVRGRHSEIDLGEAKAKEKGMMKMTTEISYLKIEVNGATKYEVSAVGMIEISGGVDRNAQIRAAIGL